MDGDVDGDTELGRSREAGRRLAWSEAYTALTRADESTPLAGADLELLATAAYLLGHGDECRQGLQRAHHLYVEHGDPVRAAWCVFWVAFTLLL